MINYSKLPQQPGCYIYKNVNNNIIYVGKAKNLKKRVASYFQKRDHDEKTLALVKNISTFDYIITDNEVEALILENTLIKEHKPRYNINFKDSKRYAYIQITDEKFPRIILARRKLDKGEFFGPFVSGQKRDYIIKFLRKVFKIRTCKKFPKKACLRHHINLCDAPCTGKISQKDYEKKIRDTIYVLKGKTQELIEKLTDEMKIASNNLAFEKAILLRNQLSALHSLNDRQNMDRNRKFNEDIINYTVHENQVFLLLFNIYKGTLTNKAEFVFNYKNEFLEEFIVQYYSDNIIPKEIILPEKIDTSIIDFLIHKKGSKVIVKVPKKGDKKKLLALAKKNVEISFFGDISKVGELQKKLKLNELPSVIECFDISHLSGSSAVGSMVQFRNGKPDKNNYRRFKLKRVEGFQDDFAAMMEVVMRRYKRLLDENSSLPDLIIIDGGKGQLNSAMSVIETLNLKTPVISIAKKFEEIYIPGRITPLRLDKREKALKYIQEIRDEAHRFAIAYNRLLRKKSLVK